MDTVLGEMSSEDFFVVTLANDPGIALRRNRRVRMSSPQNEREFATHIGYRRRRLFIRRDIDNLENLPATRHLVYGALVKERATVQYIGQGPDVVEQLEGARLQSGTALAHVELGVLLDDAHGYAILGEGQSED